MGMYFKDKTEIYKVRFTNEQAEYIEKLATSLKINKSEAVRLIVDIVRAGEKHHENKQTNINY